MTNRNKPIGTENALGYITGCAILIAGLAVIGLGIYVGISG